MGYQHRVLRAICSCCGTPWLWTWKDWSFEEKNAPTQFVCQECDAKHYFAGMSPWPKVPRNLFIGNDKQNQVEIFPIPPERDTALVFSGPHLAYSIRSFVHQMSLQKDSCIYSTSRRTEMMGEPIFRDRCSAPQTADYDGADIEEINCRIFSGLRIERDSCPLWEDIQNLCATESERKFLFHWIAFVKTRNFPMLVPQARIGITQRRRPDFALFVPLQQWRYNWYAVELDRGHVPDQKASDEARNAELNLHGYEVISLKPEGSGYYEEVRRLVERVELEMSQVESDPGSVAEEIRVIRTDESVPF